MAWQGDVQTKLLNLSKYLCSFTGKNVVHQLSVSLEDMYNGAMRKLALQKNVICDKCEGNVETEAKQKMFLKLLVVCFFFLVAHNHLFPIFVFRSWW